MSAMRDLFDTVQDKSVSVMLCSATDLNGFRQHARRLLARQTPPSQVVWHCRDARTPDLFADTPSARTATQGLAPVNPRVNAESVPSSFVELCQSVILHSDPQRFGLLYRLLWRLVHEPGLRHDPLDADRVQAGLLAQAVRRDMHKMKAFVRFRPLEDETFRSEPTGGPLHVAWFEPEHHIVEAIAPFFTRRFTQMRWAILTPERSVTWDGARACFGPGAQRHEAPPADAGEALWLTYYQHIFNPARLKLKMMQKEMPRRYWHNLPEAQFVSTLTAQAHERQTNMIAQPPTEPHRHTARIQAAGKVEVKRLNPARH